ncbi:DUF2867 domain-containing protein [Polaromonas eurypsychrophila]|uniref:DUF2867 domain-containing protein n=1 Tax=Polaromonas eurypsychrophila TaxID=1614635 RepID=UPI001E5D733F|nr:DUF2867 domain-containing protein [Polaromonas eurypsychrophila]
MPIPAGCALAAKQHDADFADAYEALVPASQLTATEIYRAITRQTPGWIEGLMRVRNQVVRLVGLKNLGTMAVPPGEAVPGKRMGLFEVVSSSLDEPGPVHTVYARCVASQKGHARGAKRSRAGARQGFATLRMAFLAATRRERG